MGDKIKILHLEDVTSDAELVERQLKKSGLAFEKLVVDEKDDYVKALKQFQPNIILSDHSLPQFNSREALHLLNNTGLKIPFILVTATMSEEFAVEMMKEGATDYILKDRMQRLSSAVTSAIDKFKTEEERKRVDEELKLLFNTIDEVYFSRDALTSRMVQISPACETVFGYTPEEFLADPELVSKIIHPDDRHIITGNRSKLERAEVVIVAFRITHKDKRVRWIESKIIPTLDEHGELIRLYGISRDITERKRDEEELDRQNRQLIEAAEMQVGILNALPPGIVLLNAAGKISAINEAWREFTILNNLGIPNYGMGYSYLPLVEKATGADKATAGNVAQGIREVITGQKEESCIEYSYLSPEGKRWMQIIIAPIKDHEQKGAVVLHIDITDRKLAEESLLQSESNLRSIFENTDLAIVSFDSDLNVISFNHNAYSLVKTHINKRLKPGSPGFKYFNRERKQLINDIVRKVKNGETVNYETTFDLTGITEWYEVKWMGVVDPKEQNIGIILTMNNITAKKNAEIDRERVTADLVRRNMDLEQFTYIISHNLRAPVANIIGLSNLMQDLNIADEDARTILNALSTSVKSLDDVILDLNQILQVNSQVNENTEAVSLGDLIREIANSIAILIQKEKVVINTDFNQVCILHTLKSYLRSIFYNLIVNSIKYRQADLAPVISINSECSNDKVIINYRDNGRGIDMAKNGKHLFGLYKRFDTTVDGKGMGLFMVKIQVQNLGGSIEVESEVNTGTQFKLTFPQK